MLSLIAADVTQSKMQKEFDAVMSGDERTVIGRLTEEAGTQTTLKRPMKTKSAACDDLSITCTCESVDESLC